MSTAATSKRQQCAASATQHGLCMLDGAHASLSPARPPTKTPYPSNRLVRLPADRAAGERSSLREQGVGSKLTFLLHA